MEVFQTENYYIFVRQEKSLWWHRITSEFTIKAGWDLSSVGDIECLGITPGILGVISLPGVYDPHLLIIKESVPIGAIAPPHLVYKIKSVCILSDDVPDSILVPCPRHSPTRSSSNTACQSPASSKPRLFESSILVNKTWGAVKSAGSTIKNTTQQAATIASNQIRAKSASKDPLKIEKRISEELHKIFDDTDSFYYCLDADITNNLQRMNDDDIDDRFFWNKYMIKDIIELEAKGWVLPIIQGFVQLEQCVIGTDCFTLSLISRRSRFRAGTRYKRRGIDENGYCANYVETEQILSFGEHHMAFTQIRGSVPVYWSQPGYKYRPPPRLDKDDTEIQLAFEKHFNAELKLYKTICIVNLVEQSGKEKLIFDAYGNHVVKYDNDKLIYVTFDFHEYCRGMRFENVSALTDALSHETTVMGFHWRDKKGTICNQNAVYRVNCMDCLDRTNVVQTAIGRTVLESQLVKVGLVPPYTPVPDQLKIPFMTMWANNGDVISRQYAGTNALKGDYTRTGNRKLTGLVKDGMNSANRYIIQHFNDTFRQCIIDLMLGNITNCNQLQGDDALKTILSITECSIKVPDGYHTYGALNPEIRLAESLITSSSYYLARFKDTYRQATIDLMLGNPVSTESLHAFGGQAAADEADALEGAEHAQILVEDCRRMLLGAAQLPIGAWGLIDADPISGDPHETEVDTILLLTDDRYLVAEYDSNLDKIVKFEKVSLNSVTEIELGLYQQQTKMFQGSIAPNLCLRLNYIAEGSDGYFHMFRSPNIRFFNNVAVIIKTKDEVMESLTAIVEFFRIALESRGKTDVKFTMNSPLPRKKSKIPVLDVPKGIPRNVSESQLVQIGSKALSNVAGQFSKFSQSFTPKIRTGTKVRNNSNPHIVYNPSSNIVIDQGIEQSLERDREKGNESSDSDENDCSIYEPDNSDLVEENPIYNENAFIPGVGIVMASTDVNPSEQKPKGNEVRKMSADVTSLTTLEKPLPPSVRSLSPAPEIHIQDIDDGWLAQSSAQKLCHSAVEMRLEATSPEESGSQPRKELALNLSSSQSENALKQLKTLASPLSKLARGMQNIGMNLDPRKIGIKSPLSPQQDDFPPEPESQKKLQEQWETSKCKTKLIAL